MEKLRLRKPGIFWTQRLENWSSATAAVVQFRHCYTATLEHCTLHNTHCAQHTAHKTLHKYLYTSTLKHCTMHIAY